MHAEGEVKVESSTGDRLDKSKKWLAGHVAQEYTRDYKSILYMNVYECI
jgi:hypothetical protein